MTSRVWYMVCICGLASYLSGCGRSGYGPMQGAYYKDPHVDLRGLGNVAFLELANTTGYPEVARQVTEVSYAALQKRQQFGIKVVLSDDPTWRTLDVRSDLLPQPQACAAIRKALDCNGLLTGVVTEYRPFPHLMIGLRMRLLDLRDGRVVWAMEQIWDASDRHTASRIKDYIQGQTRASKGSMAEQLASISTLEFLRFVAYEISRTL